MARDRASGRSRAGRVLFASGIGRVATLYALADDVPAAKLLWRGQPRSAVSCANSTPFIAGCIFARNDREIVCVKVVK